MADAMSWRVKIFMSQFLVLCGCGVSGVFGEIDLADAWRRNEAESRVVEGRGEIPGEDSRVLGASLVGGSRQHEFSGQRVGAHLNPDLPVESGLPEGIVLTGDALDLGRSDIGGGRDFYLGGIRPAPLKEINKRHFGCCISPPGRQPIR